MISVFHRFWASAAIVALAFSVVTVPGGAQTTALTPIRIANLGFTEASALPVYAQSNGTFKKYGLDATITTFNGGGAIIAAIAGGSLDAGFSNITSAVSAIQKGIPVMVIHAANLTAAGKADALLMKARGSKLKTGADLNGKTIAVTTLGGTLQLGVEQWMDKNGGDSKTTPTSSKSQLQTCPPPSRKAALSMPQWSLNHSLPKIKPTSKCSATPSRPSPHSGSARFS